MAAYGYIEGLEQRKAVDNQYNLSIRYNDGLVVRTLAVPITPRSVRRFTLMQEDYIQLEFTLAEAVNIGIGSYTTDPIFGRFFVTTEQMPKYNPATCGYDYSLRMDKDYMRLRNFIHCLVSDGKRMETSWSLTDKLAVHAQQIADNVNIVFPPDVTESYDTQTQSYTYTSTGYVIDVQDTLLTASDIKFLTFDAVDIIEALDMIAEAWECEWWVTDEDKVIGNTTYQHVIHFGKCELDNERFTLVAGDNVESIDATRDQQSFANRIYAYGSTKNVPENYDRRLLFKADTYTRSGRYITSVKDSNRELTLAMIQGDGSVTPTAFTFGSPVQGGTNVSRTYTLATATKSLSGDQTISANLRSSLTLFNDDWAGDDVPTVSITAFLYYGGSLQRMQVVLDGNQLVTDGKTWSADITLDTLIPLGSTAKNVYAEVVWKVDFTFQSSHLDDEVDCGISGTMTATADASTASKDVVVTYNGTDYAGSFSGATGIITFGTNRPPSDMADKNYTLAPLNILKVPLSWYTLDYDVGTMRMAGEKRLHLPLTEYPNRYIDTLNNQSANVHPHTLNINDVSQIVEAAVVFEDIYPRLTLRIKEGSLTATPRKQKVEHSDGSVEWEDWTQYSFKAEYENNGSWEDFPFSLEYMLDGQRLQAVFTAPATAQAQGFMLSGMTFDVGFTQGYGGSIYTIIRNNDFGTSLPNEILKPTEGDTFVLTGWNPRALDALGIVDAAEQSLADKAEEYLNAIQEGQFTFNVRMMTDVLYTYNYGGRGNGVNGLRTFGLLALGARVTINDAALPGGTKDSRIIGYEYKLDIPQDTPTYIIGETEAFSRLKQIEKQLTKL